MLISFFLTIAILSRLIIYQLQQTKQKCRNNNESSKKHLKAIKI